MKQQTTYLPLLAIAAGLVVAKRSKTVSGVGDIASSEDLYYAWRATYKMLSDNELVNWMLDNSAVRLEQYVYDLLYDQGIPELMLYVKNSKQASLAADFVSTAIHNIRVSGSTIAEEKRNAERHMAYFF